MIPAWAGKYIGIPFQEKGRSAAGVDCYGLTRLVLQEQFGLSLPSYSEAYKSIDADASRIVAAIQEAAYSPMWVRVETARAGTVGLFRIKRLLHCVTMVNEWEFLHVMEGRLGAYIADARTPEWKNRIRGYYEHT